LERYEALQAREKERSSSGGSKKTKNTKQANKETPPAVREIYGTGNVLRDYQVAHRLNREVIVSTVKSSSQPSSHRLNREVIVSTVKSSSQP
jgi:hypothetical protein